MAVILGDWSTISLCLLVTVKYVIDILILTLIWLPNYITERSVR